MGLFDFFRRAARPDASPTPAARSPSPAKPVDAPGSASDLARQIAQDTARQLIALERVDLDFSPTWSIGP